MSETMTDDLYRKILVALSTVADRDLSHLTAESSLDESGFDSLAFSQVVLHLESALAIEFPDAVLLELQEVRRVGDIYAVLKRTSPAL